MAPAAERQPAELKVNVVLAPGEDRFSKSNGELLDVETAPQGGEQVAEFVDKYTGAEKDEHKLDSRHDINDLIS